MRVIGDCKPDVIQIEPFGINTNKIEIRFRENIVEKVTNDGEKERIEYIYDEYTFVLEDSDDLRQSIDNNIEQWLVTGRNQEVNQAATLFLNAKAIAIDEFTNELVEGGIL